MSTAKTSSARRREVRRNIPRPTSRWMQWLQDKDHAKAIVYALLFMVVCSLIAITANNQTPLQLGQVTPEASVARVRFRAVDQEKTLEKKSDAHDREPAIYVPNDGYLQELNERLLGLIELGVKENIEQIPEQERDSLGLTTKGLDTLRNYLGDPKPTPDWEQLTQQFIESFAGITVLSAEQSEIERDPRQRPSKIVIEHPTLGRLDRYDNVLISIEADQNALRESVTLASKFPKSLRSSILAVVMQNPRPTYLFDEEQTRQLRKLRYDMEEPEEMTYRPGDVLIPAGKAVQQLDLMILHQERQAYLVNLGPMGRWLPIGGLVGLIVLIGVGLWLYIAVYNTRIINNAMRGLAITVLLLFCQALAFIGTGLAPKFVYATGTSPTLLAVIILAIAYDQRFALAIGTIHCLIVLVSLGQSVGFGLVIISGIAVTASLLRDVRTRSTLVSVGLWSGLAMGVTTLLVGLVDRPLHIPGELSRIGFDAFLALTTGFATGLAIQGILPAIEKMFGVTTSMTLRELNDASHPLLRRLAQEAGGTYQHSLRIADMAEAAADAIDANGLLCKVGAMYHDIGKVNKPMYFVENQGGGPNRHSKLSPAMSLLIIVGHVKDGIEMAREYSLPKDLRHFIESHHGTTLVEYFYHAAKQKREAEDMPAPTEFEFRYPGPKPQTKEAAILMLSDSTESAARALDDPTAIRIEQMVHAIANKRLMDGQFDECYLTLNELHLIEQSLVKTLCATYHSRIKYPKSQSHELSHADSTTGGSEDRSASVAS